MAEYHVTPSANQWQVKKKGGSVVSNHRKKKRAREKANSEATSGDRVVIHRQDGTIQESAEKS